MSESEAGRLDGAGGAPSAVAYPEEVRIVETDGLLGVVPVGAGNDYGHPAPSTLTALSQAPSLRLFRTDRDGTVVVDTDGRRLEVHTAG